jgi:spermidine synthase
MGRATGLLLVCAVLSGAASLIYQVVWNRFFLNLFGSTTAATSSVVASFVGGLALGALMFGSFGDRLRRPVLVYGGLELSVAVYALFLPLLLNAADIAYGPAWRALNDRPLLEAALRQAVGFTVLVVPTVLMGGTLPVMARILAIRDARVHRGVSWLYAANTLGAASGALAAGFALLPHIGQTKTTTAAVIMNAAAAILALVLIRRAAPPKTASLVPPKDGGGADAARPIRTIVLALVLSGFAALGLEVAWTRMLILLAGSSTYSFSLMLTFYILGLSFGSWWAGRWVDRMRSPPMVFAHLQLGVAAAVLVDLWLFGAAPVLAFAWFRSLGATFITSLIFDAVLAAAVVLPATIFLGATFPVAVRLVGTRRKAATIAGPVGIVYSSAGLGNVIGALAAGALLIAALGLAGSLKLFAATSALAALLVATLEPGQKFAGPVTIGTSIAVLTIAAGARANWNPLLITSGLYKNAPLYLAIGGDRVQLADILSSYRLLFYKEGSEAVVSVMETPTLGFSPDLSLAIDGKVDASTGRDIDTEILSGHLPMLFAWRPQRVLIIGLASGITLGSVERYSEARHITVAEISPAVVGAERFFRHFNHDALADPRVHLILDDGRHFLSLTRARFGVIISEPSNPWMSGPARLFTRDYFRQVRGHLVERGIYAQWLPLYGLSTDLLKDEVRTFLSVFPHVELFEVSRGDVLLLGSPSPIEHDLGHVDARLARSAVSLDLTRVQGGPGDLLGRFLLGTRGLNDWAGVGQLNTDEDGLLEFGAPHYLLVDTLETNRRALLSAPWKSDLRTIANGLSTHEILGLAQAYFARDRLERAAWLAQRALAIKPSAEADLLLGDIAAREGSWDDARDFWSKAAIPQARESLASLALERKEWAAAAGYLAELPRGPHAAGATYTEALVAMYQGHNETALALLDQLPRGGNSARSVVATYLKSILAYRTGRRDAAKAAMRRV